MVLLFLILAAGISAIAYTTGTNANKRVPPTNLHTIGSEDKHISSDKAGIRHSILNSYISELNTRGN